MTASHQPSTSRVRDQAVEILIPVLLFAAVLAVYASTAAPGTLFGDPSEYQFIPAILGIAHPPGYAFYTLLARLWQTLFPIGTVAFRTNLLAAAMGAWTVTAVYLAVWEIGTWSVVGSAQGAERPAAWLSGLPVRPSAIRIAALFAALCLAATADLWQHAIHANAHVVSAALATTHLWLLLRWWRTGRARWLGAFALTLGWAATHHPITLFGVPSYLLLILIARPPLWRRWKVLLASAACLLIGLAPLLYYPLRSPDVPFGPLDMRTWDGFWRHITARGLRVNLFHFGLADQPDRARVLWSLLRLQFPLAVIALIVVGLLWLIRRARKPALLLGAFLVTHLLFTLNTVQDVMAYLLLPFSALAIAAGLGGLALVEVITHSLRLPLPARRNPLGFGLWAYPVIALLLFAWPFHQAFLNLQRGISLRDFVAAEEFVAAIHRRFDGRETGAVLVSDWEHLTPLWVHAYTQGRALDEADLRLVYVSTSNPWAESVWQHIEQGPVYLPDYRPAVRDAGFRLIPEGDLYRVAAPGTVTPIPSQPLDIWAGGRVQIVGYDLPATTVRAGEPLALVLYQRVAEPLEEIWMPYARLGPVEARWTTDSRLLTPQWQAGEIVAERYELPVPFTLSPGEYPLRLGYADLSGGRAALELSSGGATVDLARITVLPNPDGPPAEALEQALANLDNQVALLKATAGAGLQRRQAPWQEPLVVRPGQPLHLTLTWSALASPRESLTVFIHLLDETGAYVSGHDYTPLGGSFPSYLWFPKWLPGQTVDDPYRLILPGDLTPGDYLVEVGMYGMTSLRRLSVVDLAGNLVGDRVILGPLRVE